MRTLSTFSFVILIAMLFATNINGQVAHKLESEIDDNFEITWLIDSPEDLIWLSDTFSLDADNDGIADFDSLPEKWDASYGLSADIIFDTDSSAVDWNNDGVVDFENSIDSAGLMHISGNAGYNFFTGKFNGNYHTIYNIFMSHTFRNGLFAQIYGAQIENLRLMNYRVATFEDNVGGIVGQANEETLDPLDDNLIKRCWVQGTMTMLTNTKTNIYLGGICGRWEYGRITECYTEMDIVANLDNNRRASGIVGQFRGVATMDNTYSNSNIVCNSQGGIIGGRISVQSEDAIKNCYSIGNVVGREPLNSIGNFAGTMGDVEAVSSYWDTLATDNKLGVGDGDSSVVASVVGLPTDAFGDEATFEGWDFDGIWKMGEVDGVARPYLAFQDLFDVPSSLNDVIYKQLDKIAISPNPASSQIKFENNTGDHFAVYDLNGRLMMKGFAHKGSNQINISNLDKGMYILTIGTTKLQKFIKN